MFMQPRLFFYRSMIGGAERSEPYRNGVALPGGSQRLQVIQACGFVSGQFGGDQNLAQHRTSPP